MSGNQTSTTNQTATQTADPRMQAAVAPILGQIQNVWQTPYNQAMSPQVAALTPMQQQAISGLGSLQTNNPASGYINQANQYSQLAASPENVTRMASEFYNPMSQQVLNQLQGVFGQQNAQLLGNAASSGAIGGSRYGVAAGNLANQQGLAAGQTLAGLQQQALNAAQTEQGQISQQAFTQGQLGQEALNTQIQGINAALQAGTITQQQAQQQLNALQQGAIQQTLFPQQELGAAANIAGIGTTLGGTSVGQGTSTTPVNYLGQVLGGLTAGAGLLASDSRVKENIEPIGKSFDKQTIYKFNYIGDPTTRIGLMAQEVQKKHPGAVKSINGAKAVDYGKATAKSAEIGEHRLRRDAGGDVHVPETHFPQLNLNPQPSQQQSGNSGSGGGLPGIGGLSNLSSLGDGLSSLGSSAMEGIGSLGSAIGSGIGELGGAIGSGIGELGGAVGGALEGAGEFLPMLALLRDGGSVRQHRAIGGGTGVGLGDQGVAALGGMPNPSSSGLNYNGIQSPLAPYFAQSPQVHVPQMNFPQLSLGQQGGNQAQQQQDQTAKQWSDFGTALKNNNVLGNADQALFADFGGGGADFARGGRIHRDMGGGLFSLSPEDKQNLDYLRGGAPSWLGGDTGNTPPPSAQPIGPSTLERFLNERRSAALRATPQDYDAQPQSAPPQRLLQNASLAPGFAPEKLASVNPAEPPALADTPTIVKSETYRPDGMQVQPAGFAPAQMGAAPPSVAQPKPASNQPQWGTPEWHKWADGYGRVSIQGETGRTSAFQGLKEINTHDTNGSHSYGNYGLNSGGSAQDFVRQYGLDGIGLTAPPGTPMFDWQWREAASNPVTANVLRKAEIDYYNNHYVNPTVRGMNQYLPVNIANNRAAQEYMIDKSVQQGTGTWDGNSGIGVKHIRRAQQAAEESGGDPVKFVQRMAQLDHAAVGSDFPAALHSGAYSPLGDLNRLRTRVAGALGELGEGIQALPGQIGEGIRGVFGGGQRPQSVLDRADLQPPKPGESNLDQRLREFGFNVGQPQGLGGSLGRALGIQGGLDPQTSNRLVNLGLGMMAAGPTVGVKGFPGAAISGLTAFGKGGQYALNQEQQERVQAINLANAAMNQQKQQWEMQRPQHAGTAVSYDINGMPKYNPLFQRWNPEKQAWEWIQGPEGSVGPSGNPIDANVVGPNAFDSPMIARKAMVDAQSKGTRGEDFIKTLPPTYADLTRAALSGGQDVSHENDRNAPQNKIVRELALQADPDFRPNSYKYAQDWRDPKSVNGQARMSYPTAIDHMEIAIRNAQNIPDHKGYWTSKAQNEFSLWQSKNKNDPWYTAQLENNTLLADEVAKIAVASRSGSALADRQANERALDMSQGRTSYLQTLQRMSELMASKGEAGMQSDWKKNMSKLAPVPEILTAEDKARVANIKQAADDALKGKKEQAKATQEQQQSTAEQAEGLKRRVEQSFKSVPKPQGLTDEQIIAKAREGIADGTKDPELVRKQLRSWGLNLD